MPAIDASPRRRRVRPEPAAPALGVALVVVLVLTVVALVATRDVGPPSWDVRAELAPLDALLGLLFTAVGG